MLPTMLVMLLFIAVPLLSVVVQSLFVEHEQVMKAVESCGPFGCRTEMQVDTEAMKSLREEKPLGRFNGMGTYLDANHLAIEQIRTIWQERSSLSQALGQLFNLPFYKALSFTIAYTAIVTPLVIVLGFIIALAVNQLPALFRGPVIVFSLLPMIVTPLIGSLVLFWMIDARGIIGANLQWLFDDPELSLKASPLLTWLTLFGYGIWHSIPLSFIIFFAGLQTVPKDILDSARVDGTHAMQRVRYVIIPHLMPLVIFVALVQLMDNFRVLEPIVGLNAQANATSLSYLIYSDLRGQESPLYGSASATSMMTIIGIILLLLPLLRRSWRDFAQRS